MNRFGMKLIVFVGILGAAGFAWGILESALCTHSFLMVGPDAPPPHVDWAIPLMFALLLLAVWLAAVSITTDKRKAIDYLLMLHFPMYTVIVATTVFSILGDIVSKTGTIVPICTAGIIVLGSLVMVFIAFARMRKARRSEPTPPKAPFPKAYFAAVAAIFMAVMAASALLIPHDGPRNMLLEYSSMGGWSPLMAWLSGSIGVMDVPLWLRYAAVAGALYGAVVGMFLVHIDQPDAAIVVIRRAITGSIVGAGLSSLLLVVHASLVTRLYDVAWSGPEFTRSVLLAWSAVGAFGGLLLACITHCLAAPHQQRLCRLPTALALTVPVAMVSAAFMWDYVAVRDPGRQLIARAADLEDHALFIGFAPDDTAKPTHRGPIIAHIPRTQTVGTAYQRGRFADTLALCGQVLSRYPHSAYRSAAMILKFDAQSSSWQPEVALRTMSDLERLYPRHGYDGMAMHKRMLVADLMLLGQYERAANAAGRYQAAVYRHRTLTAEAYAYEVLGRWDEAVRVRTKIVSETRADGGKSKYSLESLTRSQERLRHSQTMMNKKAGPLPRSDVSGRVLLAVRPAQEQVVCLVPKDTITARPRDITARMAGLCRGRLAMTDANGRYQILGLPEGDYELILVASGKGDYSIRAPGVPYEIRGRAVRLPDIVLTPKPAGQHSPTQR